MEEGGELRGGQVEQGHRRRRNEGNPMTSNIDFNISGTLAYGRTARTEAIAEGGRGWRRGRKNREEFGEGGMQVVSSVSMQQEVWRI